MVGALPLLAQPVCPAPGFLGRGVEARAIGTPGVLHWILPAVPDENDVSVADEAAKKVLLEAFAKVKAGNRDIVLETGSAPNFGALVQKQLPAGTTFLIVGPSAGPVNITKKPAAIRAPADICVKVTFRVPESAKIKSLAILVATAASKSPTAPGRQTQTVSLRELDPTVDASVEASVQYAAADLDLLTPGQVKLALQNVALRAYQAARTRNLTPGEAAPQANDSRDTRMGDASREVTDTYRLHGTALGDPQWPEPVARLQFKSTNPPQLTFTVENTQVAGAVRAQVVFDCRFLVLDKDKGSEIRKAEAKVLEERFKRQFGALTGTVPTLQSVLGVVRTLHEDADIAVDSSHKVTVSAEERKAEDCPPPKPPAAAPKTAPQPKPATPAPPAAPGATGAPPPPAEPPPGRVLWFIAFHQWKTIFGFKTKGEIGYSPEQKFLGGGDFNADNLMRLRETESFEIKAGNEVAKASGSLVVDRHTKVQYGARADGKFVYDANQQFGNLLGPKLRARDWSVTPKVYLNYPFNDPKQPVAPLGFSTTSAVGLEFRNVRINPQSGPAPPDSSGSATSLFVNLGPYYSVEPKRTKGGIGRFGIGLDFTGRKSLTGLGADFDFRQMRLGASLELFFGVAQAKDILVRHRRGVGLSDGRVPLFGLQRLGGTGSVRGIEEGEFVGGQLGFEQYEAGVTIRPLWNWIASLKKKEDSSKPAQAPAKEKKPKVSLIDPSTTYFKVFYDRGVVRNRASLGDLVELAHTRFGYGFEVEVSSLSVGGRHASLSLGYGKSPQSVLHTSGIALVEFMIKR